LRCDGGVRRTEHRVDRGVLAAIVDKFCAREVEGHESRRLLAGRTVADLGNAGDGLGQRVVVDDADEEAAHLQFLCRRGREARAISGVVDVGGHLSRAGEAGPGRDRDGDAGLRLGRRARGGAIGRLGGASGIRGARPLDDAREAVARAEEDDHADHDEDDRDDRALLPPVTGAGPRPAAGNAHRAFPPGVIDAGFPARSFQSRCAHALSRGATRWVISP